MKRMIYAAMILSVCSCQSAEYADPYVSMLDSYIAMLAEWDYESAQRPEAPHEPVFLACGRLSGSLPEFVYDPDRLVAKEMLRDDLSQARMTPPGVRCDDINSQRQAAYEAAVSEYQAVVSRIDAKQGKSGQ